MKTVLVVIIDPLRYDLLSLFKGYKIVKPNTLLLEGPEKTLYNTVPISLATWNVFLTDPLIFGACQIGPSQKDGTIVRAQSETLGDSLLGSVSRDHGPIQGICGLQCPPSSTKTIPRNLPTPVVHYRNKRTPTIFSTIDLGQVSRPETVRTIHHRTLLGNLCLLSPGTIPQLTLAIP